MNLVLTFLFLMLNRQLVPIHALHVLLDDRFHVAFHAVEGSGWHGAQDIADGIVPNTLWENVESVRKA